MAGASFALSLAGFKDKANKRAHAVVKKIVFDVSTSLVLKSPVGDATYWKSKPPKGYVGGRFRANWQYGLDALDTTTTSNIDKSGQTTLNNIFDNTASDAAQHNHFITNSLPYGPRLENGWSRQAPNGMVKLTVIEFQPIVRAAVAAVKNL